MFDFNLDFNFNNTDHLTKNNWFIQPSKRVNHDVGYKYARDMAKDVKVKKGFSHYSIVNGSFIFGDLIEALFVENNWYAEELTIATLSMSNENVDSLYNLLHGKYIGKLNLIVSDYFFSHERAEKKLIPYMYDQYKEFDFQLAVDRTHCKITCFKTEKNDYITIHGSANLRSSGNTEQLMINEGKELFDFNMSVINKIIENRKTINKKKKGGD